MLHPDTVAAAITAARIEDVVGDFVQLKKAGASLKSCCPFHSEKSPSFFVTPSRGIFKCFGCGEAGDAVSFLRKQGNTFPQAIEWLAKKYAIEVRFTSDRPDPEFDTKAKVRATLSAVQAHFTAEDTNAGREYWKGRAFTDETLDTFGVGYCPEVSVPLVEADALITAGIANPETGRLSFWKRTTIPLHDGRGNHVGFAARVLKSEDDGSKYIYNRENPCAKKSDLLFNLHRADREIAKLGEIWIVEGPADCMALWQVGQRNVVAVNGMFLSEQNIAAIRRFNGDKKLRIVVAIDNRPGKRADEDAEHFDRRLETHKKNERAFLEKLLPIGEVLRVKYPDRVKDMADWLATGKLDPNGIDRRDAVELWFETEYDKAKMEAATPGEVAAFQEMTAALVAKVKADTVRDIYVKRFSDCLQIGAKKLADLVKAASGEKGAGDTLNLDEFRHIKVADTYLERQPQKDVLTGNVRPVWVSKKVESLKEDYGPRYVKGLPRFSNFICEPSHTNYERIIEVPLGGENFVFFNEYQPLPRQPKPFDLPDGFEADGFDYEKIPELENTARFFKHIFGHAEHGEKYLTIGWDWLALLYLKPKQRLPAIALVSSEEGTGKSTFINLLLQIFGENGTKTEASRIASKFNALGANKCLVCVEETKDEKGGIENILKDLITSFEKVVEPKFQEARVVASFEKHVFASNHEDSFMKVGSETTRFFVLKVPTIPTKEADFEQKLFVEIPYLLHFLQKRGVKTPKTDRLWFSPKLLENEALIALRQSSKDKVHQEMEELFRNIWTRSETDKAILYYPTEYLKKMMVAYAGQLYERQTPNYFRAAALRHFRCDQPRAIIRFEMQQLVPIIEYHDLASTEVWELRGQQMKTRPIAFPVWRFVPPEDVAVGWEDPAPLLENCLKTGDPDAEKWVQSAREFMSGVAVDAGKAEKLEPAELPF